MRALRLAASRATPVRWVACVLLGLASCTIQPGAPLVSAQSPPGTGAVNAQSEPQPPGSLPPGAATSGTGFGQAQPSFFQSTFRL